LSPNIGFPKVLNTNSKNDVLQFEMLLLTEIIERTKIPTQFLTSIKLIPILHYGWTINRLIKERKLGEKVKDVWRRIKNFFLRSKDYTAYEIFITEYDKLGNEHSYVKKISKNELRKLKQREFRSKAIIPRVLGLKPTSTVKISSPSFLKGQHCNPQKYLLKSFPEFKSKHFYKINLEFSLNDEINNFLDSHNFILFDILYENHQKCVFMNYHALIVSKNSWEDINIVQATDLHLAKRNDEMFEKVSKAYENNEIEPQSEDLTRLRDSLKKRIVNPNDLFRAFIKKMNTRVFNNQLDFIFITGDIVDFTVRPEYSPNDQNIFDYNKSNWKIFKEILLDINRNSEELLCPIITIPGNHDFKPWHYDLSWAGIYKKVGLTKPEAKALKGQYPASPIRAILKTNSSLNAYHMHINPFLNFSLILGNFIFIFLNSGPDSYKEITNYVSGSPSLTGITEKQLRFIKNIVDFLKVNKFQIILSIHAPPINTPLKRGIISRFKKIFYKKIHTNIDQFKESNFTKAKGKIEKARIDDKFNLKYGTISTNWEELINFCHKNCILTISGHTHILNEFRLQQMDITEKIEADKADSSLAVFYDDYSDICNNYKKIKKFKPFIVQTPALGFKSYKKPGKIGGFRDIKIKNGNLNSFKVKYV